MSFLLIASFNVLIIVKLKRDIIFKKECAHHNFLTIVKFYRIKCLVLIKLTMKKRKDKRMIMNDHICSIKSENDFISADI